MGGGSGPLRTTADRTALLDEEKEEEMVADEEEDASEEEEAEESRSGCAAFESVGPR